MNLLRVLRHSSFLLIAFSGSLNAQENAPVSSEQFTRIYIISSQVGADIDSAEKKRFHLFPFYKSAEYVNGIFYKKADSSYVLISSFKDGSIKSVNYSEADIRSIRRIIESDTVVNKKMNRLLPNIIYPEGFGCMGKFSLNFERIVFNKENVHLSMRFAVGFQQGVDNYTRSSGGFSPFGSPKPVYLGSYRYTPVLISVNLFTGMSRNFFEFDLGYRYNFISAIEGTPSYDDVFSGWNRICLQLCYRYQKPGGVFFFRGGVLGIGVHSRISIWPTVSLGLAL